MRSKPSRSAVGAGRSAHRLGPHFAALLSALLLSLACAGSASAAVLLESFDGTATPAGSFEGPQKMDFHQDSGTLYLLDSGHDSVIKLNASGVPQNFSALSSPALDGAGAGQPDETPQGGLGLTADADIAVDNSGTITDGNIYVGSENGHLYAFDSSGTFLYAVDGSGLTGTPTSSLDNPCGVAVDSAGNIFVSGYSAQAVRKFTPGVGGAEYVSEFPVNGNPCDLAIDPSDNLYVNYYSGAVERFDSGGSSLGVLDEGPAFAVAVNPASGRVYIAFGEGNGIRVYEPDGGFAGAFAQGSQPLRGLAVEALSGKVFATGTGGDLVRVFGPGAPSVSGTQGTDTKAGKFGWLGKVTSTTARLKGRVIPNGVQTSYHFEYVEAEEFEANGWDNAISSPNPAASAGDGEGATEVTTQISGLEPATSYRFRLVAENALGTTAGPTQGFTTQPLITTSRELPDGRAYELVTSVDKLGGDVIPFSPRTRSSTDGNAVTFTSKVAFADSGGTNIYNEYVARRGADDWVSHGLTPNQHPYPYLLPDPLTQSVTEWFTDDLSKAVIIGRKPLTDAPNVADALNLYMRDDVLDGGGPNPGDANYQLLTDSEIPVPPTNEGQLFGPKNTKFAAASADLSQVIFESKNRLTADAPVGESPKVYEWDHGTVRLASVLPDSACASPPCISAEAQVGVGVLSPGSGYTYDYASDLISVDGSKVFFTDSPEGTSAIYARLDHTTTIQLNASERTDCQGDPTCGGDSEPDPQADPSGPQRAVLQAATPDGSKVFFVTEETLSDDDHNTNPELQGETRKDLYMYEFDAPVGERLTVISRDSEPSDGYDGDNGGDVNGSPHGAGVAGISDDGSYVYFWGENRLEPGASSENVGKLLYVWHDGEIRFVGGGEGEDEWDPNGTFETSKQNSSGRTARVTPDGRSLLFSSQSDEALTGYDNHCPENTGALAVFICAEVYLYTFADDRLVCVSCNPTGQPPKNSASFTFGEELEGTRFLYPNQYLNNAISEDGSRVFFTSPDALLPQDTNGRMDAYQYDVASGDLHLLSTGQCNCNSYFVEASPNGRDAFFVTTQQLVRVDTDTNKDLYDARIGGGLPKQNALPEHECEGDACAPSPVVPNDATPGSSSFSGPGDVQARRRAAKRCRSARKSAAHSAKRKGKAKCAKPKRNRSRNQGRNR